MVWGGRWQGSQKQRGHLERRTVVVLMGRIKLSSKDWDGLSSPVMERRQGCQAENSVCESPEGQKADSQAWKYNQPRSDMRERRIEMGLFLVYRLPTSSPLTLENHTDAEISPF